MRKYRREIFLFIIALVIVLGGLFFTQNYILSQAVCELGTYRCAGDCMLQECTFVYLPGMDIGWMDKENCCAIEPQCGGYGCDYDQKPAGIKCELQLNPWNSCVALFCVDDPTCRQDECSPEGATTCNNDNKMICEPDGDGVLVWVFQESCLISGDSCGYGNCSFDQIATGYCSGGIGSAICSYICEDCEGDTSCRGMGCADNERPQWSCSTNECTYSCVLDAGCSLDKCSPKGITRCSGTGNGYDICSDCNGDGWLEWCGFQSCVGDAFCGAETCFDDEKPAWYCSEGNCYHLCVYDESCFSCSDECSDGTFRCFGNVTQTCGSCDDDNCLEWCDGGDCSNNPSVPGAMDCTDNQRPVWFCAIGAEGAYCDYYCDDLDCVDECSSGASRCSGNVVQTCGSCDDDNCLEWCDGGDCSSRPTNCAYGSCSLNQTPSWYCFAGDCLYNCYEDSNCCADECSSGSFQCSGSFIQTCGGCDSDNCLDWCIGEDCSTRSTDCGYGGCNAAQRADNWRCENGGCAYDCDYDDACFLDDCSPAGAVQCSGDTVQTCGDCDSDPALEWCDDEDCSSKPAGCGLGGCPDTERSSWSCQEGACYFDCAIDPACDTCDDECSPGGAVQCFDSDHTQTCGLYENDDDCLEWSSPESCTGDSSCGGGGCGFEQRSVWSCDNGFCVHSCEDDPSCEQVPECEDDCFDLGRTQCSDGFNFVTCGDYDEDYCLDLSLPEVCTGDTSCGYEACENDEKPSWYCDDSIGFCGYECNKDSECGSACDDKCSFKGELRCFDQIRTQMCDDYNDDGCLEWSPPDSCIDDLSCSFGNCNDDAKPSWQCSQGYCIYDCFENDDCCTNECSLSAVKCADNSHSQVCGYYDDDKCLEWSSESLCEGSEACDYGDCSENQRPDWRCSGNSCTYTCIDDETCSTGMPCEDDCSEGQVQCFDDNHEQICSQYDDNDCLDWSYPGVCEGDLSCGYGDCSVGQKPNWYCIEEQGCGYSCLDDSSCIVCEDECLARWLTRCTDENYKQVCGYYYDTDPCLEWYPPELCGGDTSCSYENCDDDQKPVWYCGDNICQYECREDSSCVSDYIKKFRKDCHEDDIYWFDSRDQVQDKYEECEDDNSDTIDGCKNGKCFNWTEEERYCQIEDHCGDGACNCDEDVYVCFEDCEFANLAISVFVKEDSEREWKDASTFSPKDKIDVLLTIFNDSNDDFDNILVQVQLPQEVVYDEGLKIGDVSLKEGSILDGINIGFLPARAEKAISFEAKVSSQAEVGVETEVIGLVKVADIFNSDAADITIEKVKRGFWEIIKWFLTRWYIWLLLWIILVVFLYWFLKRKNRKEKDYL